MTKPSSLIYLIAFCIHLSTLTAGQSLFPEGFGNFDDFPEGYFNEEALIEDYNRLEENTPEEISAAVSKNAVRFINAMIEEQTAEVETILYNEEALNLETEEVLLPSFLILSFEQYSGVIGDKIGNLVADGLGAFKDAQANGEDAGAAVGLVLSNAIRDLNNSAKAIQDAIEQILDESVAMIGGPAGAGDLGASFPIEKIINSLSTLADDMGQKIADAINNAVGQGGDPAHILGATWRHFIASLADDGSIIGGKIADAIVDAYGGSLLPKAESDMIKAQTTSQAVEHLESWSSTSGEAEQELIYMINGAIMGTPFGKGPAKDIVDVINRVGDILVGH